MGESLGLKQKLAAFGVAILLLGFFGWLGRPTHEESQTFNRQQPPAESNTPSTPEQAFILVQIAGEVQTPGLYEVEDGARVFNLIELAGGFTADASEDRVNQAAKLRDGDLIVIPKIGEPAATKSQSASSSDSGSDSNPQAPIVRISTADLEQLQTLPGVGPVIASNIIRYREQYGAFEHKNELMAVEGVTAALFERIEPLIVP